MVQLILLSKLVRSNIATPLATKFCWKPGPVGRGSNAIKAADALDIRFAGMMFPGNAVRNAGSGLDAGSKIHPATGVTLQLVPAGIKEEKSTPFGPGRSTAGARLTTLIREVLFLVVRSRSEKKNNLFVTIGPPIAYPY